MNSVTCNGCRKDINKDKETYWEVFTPSYKAFCGINCYRKDQQQEEQKRQALNTPK